LAEALEAVAAGYLPPKPQSDGLIRPMLRMLRNLSPVLDRAGSGAWADMWRVAPPLAFIAIAFKVLGVGPRKEPGPGRHRQAGICATPDHLRG